MTRRSIVLVACGVVAVLVGVAVAFLGRSSGDGTSATPTVAVLVAGDDIEAGTGGTAAAAEGLVVVRQVEASEVQAGALGDPSQLTGRTFAEAVGSGQQVRSAHLSAPALRDATIEVPEGTQAVAIEVPFISGGAGYVAPGDSVNVFALLDPADGTTAVAEPSTVDLLANVVVLDVSQEVGPRVAARETGSSTGTTATTPATGTPPAQLTYLLAVPTAQVGALIQATAFHRLYISIPPRGTPPAPAALVDDGDLVGGGR